mmetsp:Transcript_16969/g.37264  ORF Transcript_16969/g.37264 Transcript_16969/m.37264 type:complete len:319 (+) Transcript_16969:2-958(+)
MSGAWGIAMVGLVCGIPPAFAPAWERAASYLDLFSLIALLGAASSCAEALVQDGLLFSLLEALCAAAGGAPLDTGVPQAVVRAAGPLMDRSKPSSWPERALTKAARRLAVVEDVAGLGAAARLLAHMLGTASAAAGGISWASASLQGLLTELFVLECKLRRPWRGDPALLTAKLPALSGSGEDVPDDPAGACEEEAALVRQVVQRAASDILGAPVLTQLHGAMALLVREMEGILDRAVDLAHADPSPLQSVYKDVAWRRSALAFLLRSGLWAGDKDGGELDSALSHLDDTVRGYLQEGYDLRIRRPPGIPYEHWWYHG